jgi:hypothetical protein
MRWTRRCRKTSDADPLSPKLWRTVACRVSLEKASVYGKAVWSWQPDAGAKLRETCFRAATGARKPGPRGERGISRQTIAQGRPGCSDHTCGSFPVLFSRTGAAGVADTRPSLRPLR